MHELLASTNKQASLQMPFGYLNCDIFLVFHMYLQFGDGMKPGWGQGQGPGWGQGQGSL